MSRDVVASGASCPRNPGACWHWLHDDFSPSLPSPDFNGKHQEPPDNKRGGSGTEAKKPQRLCPQRRQALPRSGPHPGRGFLWRGLDCGLLGDAGDTWVPGQGAPCVRDNPVLFTKVAGETRGAGHLADLQAPSRSSRVHSGSQTEHCTRSAEGDRGVTSVPVSGGWGRCTDGSISTSRQLTSPAAVPGAALTVV